MKPLPGMFHPQNFLVPLCGQSFFSFRQLFPLSVFIVLPFPECHVIYSHAVVFWVWLLSFSMVILRSAHVVASVTGSFFFAAAVLSLSCVWLFLTPWTVAPQASLNFTISWSLLKLMSIESVMPSNLLILCCLLLLLPSIFPSIRVFSSESALHIRWPKY